ncbi:MAG: hypothetical protein M2R45_05383 [Verrucomicrobia subdivision 3 bacterium]|nr:hypothetical protein [Limisphaerales bacterium]MCS1417771.1 hypothetical protein [Limisphaerales bacterium]
MNESVISQWTHVVLYDGDCPLCTFQKQLLTWLDWFNVVSFVPISDARASGLVPNISRADLMEAVQCLARDGKVYRGARCIRFVGMRMPVLIPLSLMLWIPGVIWVAEIIYRWISRNRLVLSRLFGCKGACIIFPGRQRNDEL